MLIFKALSGILSIILNFTRGAVYAYLIFLTFQLVKDLKLEKVFKKVTLLHQMILTFVIVKLAWSPLAYILDLLSALPDLLSATWLGALVSLGQAVLLIYVLEKLFHPLQSLKKRKFSD